MNDWLYEGKHGFTYGYSRESQVIAVFQGIANHLEKGAGIDVITIEFPKTFDLFSPHRLLTKLAGWA